MRRLEYSICASEKEVVLASSYCRSGRWAGGAAARAKRETSGKEEELKDTYKCVRASIKQEVTELSLHLEYKMNI